MISDAVILLQSNDRGRRPS